MSSRPAVRQLGRLSEIAQVAARHGFGYLFERRSLLGLIARRGVEVAPEDESSPRGVRVREMLEELGPTFVKFGQIVSTRPDIIPPDIIFELRKLQDAVPPFPLEDVERVFYEDFGLTIEQLFVEFEPVPIAAASIGQVHRAVLPNGQRVAVKVQRPDAPRQIEADLELLYQAARLVRDRIRRLGFIDPVGLVDEFARTIRQELDYRLEARHAQQFARHFQGDERVRVPRVFQPYTSARGLTLELLDGVPLNTVDVEALTVDERRDLAYRMAEVWMEMIFRHGFFHGDPHPGNILVLDDRRIGLLDFGMVGQLSSQDLAKLTSLFLDVLNENVEALPRRLAALGVRYPREREQEFAAELTELFYRYYGASLADIDPIELIREAFGLIYRMHLQLPSRFVLLDRAIATLASVGQELFPDFNVFDVARPYARDLLLDRYRPRRLVRTARRELSNYASIGRSLPYQVADVLEELRDGEMEIQFRHKGLDALAHRLDVLTNRLVIALVAVGGVIGSALIGILAESGPHVLGLHVVSIVGFSVSTLLALWLTWAVIRSGRI
jgi:ubiquinone biosynthesis protein